jgi:hypothetical protein
MIRSQLRTTSLARSAVPSLKRRPGRRRNTTRRPSSSKRHDSASAGWMASESSSAVSDSKNWAIIAELWASPVAAGSSSAGALTAIRAVPLGAPGGCPPQAPAIRATRSMTIRRRIGRSIRAVLVRAARRPIPGT